MILEDIYQDAVAGRVAALDTGDPSSWPRMSLILDRCVDRLAGILALLESGDFGDGWDGDIATLGDLAAGWMALSDALQIVERQYAAQEH